MKLIRLSILCINILALSWQVHAQDNSIAVRLKLKNMFEELYRTSDYQVQKKLSDTISTCFTTILNKPESFNVKFDSIKHLGVTKSSDETFRIFGWDLIKPDGSYKYYGLIQYFNKNKNSCLVTSLVDKSDSISNAEQKALTSDEWYGALYYKIVPFKSHGRTLYVLLGWNGGNLMINRKVIEVLSFNSRGVPRFGKNIFKFGKKNKKRVIFEYSYMATMKLTYDNNLKAIVFEHLVPIEDRYRGQRSEYGSDLSFDGLKYDGNKWIFEENVKVKNKKIQTKKKKKISYTF